MLPIGLCAYALPYSIGFVGRGTARAMPNPLGGPELLDLAQRLDLCGVEIPAEMAGKIDALPAPDHLREFRAEAEARGLALTLATPPLDADALIAQLECGAQLGARVVRTMLSSVLCGDRGPVGGLDGWRRLLEERIQILKSVAPVAEALDIRIGVENHQDATADELVYLCEAVNSTHVGVTLDTGNPLAVADDPIRFARTILPHLVHVHLKDYRVTSTPQGYRLFHCPIGAGVVDFRTLFGMFRRHAEQTGFPLGMNLEMAMLGERHIRILEDDYWAGHEPRAISHALYAFQLREEAEQDADWRTPWDLGEDVGVSIWELERLAQSVENMRPLV